MKHDWGVKKLGDICWKITDGSHNPPKGIDSSDFMMLSSKNVFDDSIHFDDPRYLTQKDFENENKRTEVLHNDVLLTIVGTIGRVAVVPIHHPKFTLQRSVAVLKPKDGVLDSRFLMFSLQNILKFLTDEARGAAQKGIYLNQLRDIKISIPTFYEQERIVEIVDKAFAAIAIAKANAEQNLKNSKELFESYLRTVFKNIGADWEEKRFDEICVLQRGFDLPTHSRNEGTYPLVSSNGITDRINLWKVKGPGVVTGRSGTIGTVHFIEEDYWPLNTALYVKEFYGNYEKCTYYFLKQFDLGRYSSGAGVPTLNRNNVHGEMVWYPKSIAEQQAIAQKLDNLSAETKKLEAVYQQKIDHLEELKKSVLQKAFSGELTQVEHQTKIIELPVKIPGISATDLQAGIVAIALKKHKEQNRDNSFHHVKAEKIVHLAEAILNIDLERNPFKDAAGPNDFPHAKKVESRAQKAGFFTVRKINDAYEYTEGTQFETLVAKASSSLNEKLASLNRLIDLMVPMSTQQAEIVATVYAAWNNLLIDNVVIDDEAIVHEARENWHNDKLKIDRDKFFKAIVWMRGQGLVPLGYGKKVLSKSPAKVKQ